MSIEEKTSNFRMACNSFRNEFPAEIIQKFFDYWTEPNRAGTKLRWELEKTWEIKRRLKRWLDNENKWHGTKSVTNQQADQLNGIYRRIDGIIASHN